jgi:hypothetical protein
MSDLQARSAEFETDSANGEFTVIVGRAPVATLHGYVREVLSYTRGRGRFSCTSGGYEPCHNAEEIISAAAYDPEADLINPPHSVFCAGGAGFTVPWQEVEERRHIDIDISLESGKPIVPRAAALRNKYSLSEDEVEALDGPIVENGSVYISCKGKENIATAFHVVVGGLKQIANHYADHVDIQIVPQGE